MSAFHTDCPHHAFDVHISYRHRLCGAPVLAFRQTVATIGDVPGGFGRSPGMCHEEPARADGVFTTATYVCLPVR